MALVSLPQQFGGYGTAAAPTIKAAPLAVGDSASRSAAKLAICLPTDPKAPRREPNRPGRSARLPSCRGDASRDAEKPATTRLSKAGGARRNAVPSGYGRAHTIDALSA